MVDAEYGNQGIDFECVPREGFGWSNASFEIGLTFLTTSMKTALSVCTTPDVRLCLYYRKYVLKFTILQTYFSRRQNENSTGFTREMPSIPPAIIATTQSNNDNNNENDSAPLADKRKRLSYDISQAVQGLGINN